MRKYLLIIGLVAIAIGCNNAFATGDKQITSKTYVENQLATKQDKIPAVDTNTVLTHTGTNGAIGQKAIYDSGENYVSQQTALMTAGDANTGINTALENEFICIDWDTDGTCLLWNIKNTSPQRILPEGYTALEYLESTGTQYIDTEIQKTSNNFKVEVDVSFADSSSRCLIGTATESPNYGGRSSDGKFELNFIDRTVMSSGVNERVKLEFYGPGNGRTYLTVTKNGVSETLSSTGAGSATTTRTFKIFANTSTNGTVNNILKGNIYYAKLFIKDDMKRNLIPARRDSDGELGMYDLVSNTFFTNQGSGTFVAGPDLDLYVPSGN